MRSCSVGRQQGRAGWRRMGFPELGPVSAGEVCEDMDLVDQLIRTGHRHCTVERHYSDPDPGQLDNQTRDEA